MTGLLSLQAGDRVRPSFGVAPYTRSTTSAGGFLYVTIWRLLKAGAGAAAAPSMQAGDRVRPSFGAAPVDGAAAAPPPLDGRCAERGGARGHCPA